MNIKKKQFAFKNIIAHRDIEDAYHFIQVCEKYEDIRKMYSKTSLPDTSICFQIDPIVVCS